MISSLASPTVCVIDDDEEDYKVILKALNDLHIGCVHVLGKNFTDGDIPAEPFKGLRLVFADLHLNGTTGKTAASHTANIFQKVVSPKSAPTVVVIWSKYAKDISGAPPEDQESEAELFKRTLLEADGEYAGRLIFLDMEKAKLAERGDSWISTIREQISQTLEGKDGVDALLAWEALAKEAVLGVSEGITTVCRYENTEPDKTLENIKTALQLLVLAQGKGDLSASTAPRHLASVMSQLLVDQLDHPAEMDSIKPHAEWLSTYTKKPQDDKIRTELNAFLLTMSVPAGARSFMPGTIYRGIDDENFKKLFGVGIDEFLLKMCNKNNGPNVVRWKNESKPILLELSPSCDVAQSERRNALLIAGVIAPANLIKHAKDKDSFERLPNFALRQPATGFPTGDVFLAFCSRYKVTLPEATTPEWLTAWFRLRDMPTASLRNWHASHASRVGFVSLLDD